MLIGAGELTVGYDGVPQYSLCVCVLVLWICIHKAFVFLSLCRAGRQEAECCWHSPVLLVCCGSHCLIGRTLCVCMCVCVHVSVHLFVTRTHPNTSGPAAAAELILAQDVRTPQFP